MVAPPTSPDSVPATFGGNWVVTNDPSQPKVLLDLTQPGPAVPGTLKSPTRAHRSPAGRQHRTTSNAGRYGGAQHRRQYDHGGAADFAG